MMKIRTLSILLFVAVSAFGQTSSVVERAEAQLRYKVHQTEEARKAVKDKSLIMPRSVEKDGSLRLVNSSDWCCGFYPGELWNMYALTGNDFWKNEADDNTWLLEDTQYHKGSHDIGFMMYSSFGKAYEQTHDKRYLDVLMQSARSLTTRFNPTIGCIRSWSWGNDRWTFPVIIDNMMNLELLFEATRLSGDSLYHRIAVTHADRTLANHFRSDNSSYHVVDYDPFDGHVIKRVTFQGLNDKSVWSRGQAWGLYGFTMCYRYTHNKTYLRKAQDIARFFFNQKNMLADMIPLWDMKATATAPRDASAAAIFASGLYELANYSDAEDADYFRGIANRIMDSLAEKYLSPLDENQGFLLMHSTGNHPGKDEIDTSISYADYYFLEALKRREESKTNELLASFTLPTPWSADALTADVPLNEYPRPQMVRSEWLCLNGMWNYMGGADVPSTLHAESVHAFPKKMEQIRVPFPAESDLSGIKRKQEKNLWYQRYFQVPKEWNGKNVILHFEAVDHEAVVFVNGKKVGTHTGSYDSFSFDITSYLHKGDNELVVAAYDTNDGRAPSGKNGPRGDYTFCSGIWQTVWMEPVEKSHVTNLRLVPDVENGRLAVTVEADGNLDVTVTALSGNDVVSSAKGLSNKEFFLPMKNAHLWSPDDPFLYDLKVELKKGSKTLDAVDSYFGMRSCTMGKVDGVMRPLLNGQFVFHLGPLDQGYWPDGIFTAPTDKALLYDIELAKRAGFNLIRKHIKVEPKRWYYHCDRLGLMVWQDMPNIWEPDDEDSLEVRSEFRRELRTIIDQHISCPSIVMWVPFNENWGAFEVREIAEETKQYDPSRWVNGMSGYNYAPGYRKAYGDPGNSDFVDIHTYGHIAPNEMAKPTDTRAASLGEFGGKGLFVRGHMWPVRNDAYDMKTSVRDLTDTYIYLLTEVEQMKKYHGLSTAIYTQTTDVEHEVNGLVTYDRKVEKMDIPRVKEINESIIHNK